MPEPFNTNGPERNEPVIPSRAFWWFKCSAQIVDADNVVIPNICKANLWDGTNKGNTDYVIRVFSLKQEGDIFYATRPEGGTGVSYTDANGKTFKVVWMETPVGVVVAYAKVKIAWQPNASGNGSAFITVVSCDQFGNVPPVPGGGDPPTFKLRVTPNISKTTWYAAFFVNDVVQYVPVANDPDGAKGTVFGTPIIGGALRSLFQTTGTSACGFDILRSHNLT